MMFQQWVKHCALVVTVCVAGCAGQVVASEGNLSWQKDYKQAEAQAKQEGKAMVVLFTGTAWCPACQTLESQVLDTAEFADAVGDKYIFVQLVYPWSDDHKDQNEALKNEYNITAWPTMILLDKDGKIVDRIKGVPSGGPEGLASILASKLG